MQQLAAVFVHYILLLHFCRGLTLLVRYDMLAAALIQFIVTNSYAALLLDRNSETSTGAKWMSWTCKSVDCNLSIG